MPVGRLECTSKDIDAIRRLGQRHRYFVALADISHVSAARFDKRLGGGRSHDIVRFGAHFRIDLLDDGSIEFGQAHVSTAHHLVGNGRGQHADGGPHAGAHRHDHFVQTELRGNLGSVLGRCTAVGDENPFGKRLTPLGGMRAGSGGHVLVHHLANAERRCHGVHVKHRPDPFVHRRAGRRNVERHGASTESPLFQPAHDGIRVRDRRISATPSIARGAGFGPRTFGSDPDAPEPVHQCDGAPAGTDFHHLDDGNADR